MRSGRSAGSRPYNPNSQRAAELIQADWAKVGVKAEIVNYEWTEVSRSGKKKDRDGAFRRLDRRQRRSGQLPRDPVLLLRPSAGRNYSSWCNKDFEDLIQKAKTTSDRPSAPSSTRGAGRVQGARRLAFTLAHSQGLSCRCRKKSRGFMMDPLGIHRFDGVDKAE